MKTRKALVAMLLAAFSLSMIAAAFAQTAAPAKPAPATTPAPAPAAKVTAAKPATTAKPAPAVKKEAATAEVKVGSRSIIGEVVDPACWIVNGSRGATHKECAIACAKAGQVLGILETKTQKLYMLATDKPGEDPNKELIAYVGQLVLVKGRVYSRGGATGIKVASVEPYSPTAIPQ